MKSQQEFSEFSNQQHSDTTMRLMLDAQDLLREIEIFLKGQYETTIYNEATKQANIQIVSVGSPKANDQGVQSIMFWLKTRFNPLMSLGNISEDQYYDFLGRSRASLAKNLMINRHNYNIKLSDYSEIIDTIFEAFEIFMSSPIKAGHRSAMTQHNKTETREVIDNTTKKFGIF